MRLEFGRRNSQAGEPDEVRNSKDFDCPQAKAVSGKMLLDPLSQCFALDSAQPLEQKLGYPRIRVQGGKRRQIFFAPAS
jgi:hypothetical protein